MGNSWQETFRQVYTRDDGLVCLWEVHNSVWIKNESQIWDFIEDRVAQIKKHIDDEVKSDAILKEIDTKMGSK